MDNFKIDKNDLIPKFKEYISQYAGDEEKFEPKYAKEVKYSRYNILKKIQKIYYWVLKNAILDLRQRFIHDDKMFNDVKGKIESHINNKIRTSSDGTIYLKVGDISFDGDKDQYDEWIVSNKKNQERLIRKIVDELNSVLDGNVDVDENKPILSDEDYTESIEEVVEENSNVMLTEEEFDKLVDASDILDKLEAKLSENGLEKERAVETANKTWNLVREYKLKKLEKDSEK